MARNYLKLGAILVQESLISEDQIKKVIEIQKKEGGRIGEILVKLGMVTEKDIVVALGKQLSIPYVTLGPGLLTPTEGQGLEDIIAKEFAVKNLVLPLSKNLSSLTCAMYDPLDIILLDNLKKITGCEINPIVATKSDLLKAIEEFYSKVTMLREAVRESYSIPKIEELINPEVAEQELGLEKLIAKAEEAPVVKLVDLIIRQAIDERASDIHIEPFKNKLSLRYRIDGALYEIHPPARHLHLPIVSRIKILARLDIAEKRLPQDGGFSVRIDENVIDLRISIIPTLYGEKAVIRILDKSKVEMNLDKFGFDAKDLQELRRLIRLPYGLVLLTGPTGSGKTTTLYAILSELKDPRKNIITVEDPIEYHFDGINQVQVKPEIGLTFATALRSFLRQDPDIMLVGEIRDLETAEICVRSALTGHMVFSTLHTNDAPAAVTRLLDIGIETYLLVPSLVLIAAQRLIRRLCPECKEPHELTSIEKQSLGIKAELIYRAKGCDSCNHVGYKGRVAIIELMSISEKVKQLIYKRAGYKEVRKAAEAEGMSSLYANGISRVEQGITSLEEVLGVTQAREQE